ncbi:MAG: hypothetical protein M3R24_08095 [Chloroflexota bacterium]|nr:hypothetical protein [Chloroflexota bacterium]
MAEPIRWVLLDSLNDILSGNLRNDYPEGQDLLASTFGEMLGALLMAFRLKGEVEIVRLMETNSGKTPDFLIFEQTLNGKLAHLLECKGSVEDVRNINQRASKRLDVCQHIRDFRGRGEEQLDQVVLKDLKVGPMVITHRKNLSFGLAQGVVTKNLVITCVPDGRILRLLDVTITQAPRGACAGKHHQCTDCMLGSKLDEAWS